MTACPLAACSSSIGSPRTLLCGAQPVGHPGGFQTQLNATLDARIARDFALPRGVLSACFDVFNILNANNNTLESDLSGPAFLTRVPLAVEAPRTARLGVQWKS